MSAIDPLVGNNTNGNPMIQFGIKGGVDRRQGVTLTIPVWVPTLIAALNYEPPIASSLPFPITRRTFSECEGGGYECELTYEGLSAEVTPALEGRTTFEVDVTMTEVPIQASPNFEALTTKYGWDATKDEFPKFLPPQSQSAPLSKGDVGTSGSASTALGKGTPSPAYGISSWYAPSVVYRVSYITAIIDPTIFLKIGQPVQTPPQIGTFSIPGNKNVNWLYMGPKIRMKGNDVEVTREWLRSGPRGWNADIYNFSALIGSTGGTGAFGSTPTAAATGSVLGNSGGLSSGSVQGETISGG